MARIRIRIIFESHFIQIFKYTNIHAHHWVDQLWTRALDKGRLLQPSLASTRQSENSCLGLWLPCLLRRLTWVAANMAGHCLWMCFTLRSWVRDMFSHFRTVSPGLGDNYASKCSSDSFPHTKYMSPCVENSQNHTLMFRFSPIPGRKFEKQGKLWDIFVP